MSSRLLRFLQSRTFVGVPDTAAVEAGPTARIDPGSYRIEDGRCIRCFACTQVCPSGTKTKVVQPAEQLASWFRHRPTEGGDPLLFFQQGIQLRVP